MLLMPNKKKIATVIVGSKPDEHADFVDKGPSGGLSAAHVGEGPGEDDSYAYEQMAHDIIAAVSSHDAKRLVSCLKSFFEMCDGQEDQEEGATIEGV